MKRHWQRLILSVALLAAVGGIPHPLVSSAEACPSCKAANATTDRRPKAYMASILFMLAMPATVFTGFGVAFYRMSRKAAATQLAANDTDNITDLSAST
jgi:hypothetical protein